MIIYFRRCLKQDVSVYLSKKISTNRMRVALKTDYRIRLMNDIVSGIQVIKMYAWEKPFSRLVNVARVLEIQEILRANLFRSINYILPTFLKHICIYLCVLAATFVGVPLLSSFVFVVELLYNDLNNSVFVYLPVAVTHLAELRVSIKRIEDFLDSPVEKSLMKTNRRRDKIVDNCTLISVQQKSCSKLQNRSTGVYLENIRVKWNRSLTTNILNGVDFSAQMGELIGIIGASGSGKSTLLQTILKEVDPMEGSVDVRGVVSYASQDPWFFSDSIRNNILFGKAMNREKYHEVVKVCALEHDLSVLPFGDGTLVGEQGAMLSGGQKARISLARAIYRDADIYLLDDPLSAVDAHVAQHIFNECIGKYLKDKCVILVTHQVQYLKDVPRVYQLNEGKLCGLKKSKKLQPSTFMVVKNIEQVSDAQTLLELLKNDEEASEVKEHRSTGSSFKKIYGVYFRAGGNWLVTSVIFFAFVVVQCCASSIEFFLSHWINLVQEHKRFETESERILISRNYIYIYSGLLLCLVLVTITATLAFVHYCMIASKNLHNSMLGKIIYATMTFFDNHPSGRILNRFSKDIGNVDEFVPLSLLTVIVTFLNLVAMFVTICVMNYWMILPTAFLLLICGVFAAVYQPSNRNIKRTEGVTKSPIYTHLASSLQGLTTIRAFNAQELLQNQFDKHQNVHSAAYYMYLAIYNAFAFWIDFISTIYVGIVIFSFFFIASGNLFDCYQKYHVSDYTLQMSDLETSDWL
jgi:ATP-binding cassette subfamily C (CFTR/MRP) protein 4